MISNDSGRRLKTTQTSLEILTLILEHEGLTVAELDRMVSASKSSICSHLNTLRDSRFLIKEGDTYQVGFRLALLGERAKARYPREETVREVVDGLAADTGQEANFTILEHGRLLLFYGSSDDEVSREDSLHYRSEYYLHNTAAGKAILAELDRDRIEAILDRWGLPRESEATIANREQLFDSLEDVGSQDFVVADGEFAPGLVSVGAPVHDHTGDIVGGLSVGGPKFRLNMTRLETDIADELLDAVAALEESLREER
ncbi:IclR family transcriptional regulator [Halobellus rubicundus]|uniref:IclR family transcriptional regulator n=1 Tax=Halobellus rubicundus TaxID=2996466 RepID=A0ABD5MDS4_9EURY